MKCKVLIADDHQVVIDGLTSLIKGLRAYEVVACAKNGWEVIEYIEQNGSPDLLLMDVTMPEKDGIETMQYFQEKGISIKVIILTMHLSGAFARKLLSLGVKGYLQKDCDKQELLQALEDVKNGGTYLSKNMTELLVNEGAGEEKGTTNNAPRITKRELDILRLLLDELSSRQIAETLNISFNTVETHRKHLLNKFEVSTTVGLIREALRNGVIK